MKQKTSVINYLIIIIVIVLLSSLCYILFFNKKSIDFKLNTNNIQLKLGSKKKIDYSLNDNQYEIEWSSNNNVVTINENGEVVANSYGKALITGVIKTKEGTYADTCVVTVYSGEENNPLQEIIVPSGYLLIKPNSEYELPFTLEPVDAYVTAISYTSSDDTVATIENDKIISKNEGVAVVSLTINNQYSRDLMVKVTNLATENKIVKKIENVSLDKELTMEMGDVKKLNYVTSPENGYIESISWSSSDEKVISIESDDSIKAVNIGTATIKLIINEEIEASVNVKVQAANEELVINYNPKTVIRIGEKTTIKSSLSPVGINDSIVYKSSNPNVAKIENGTITGVSAGSSTITLSISNGKTKSYTINVLPSSGSLSGSGNFWGYKSLNEKTPVTADTLFFQKLAQNGTGTFQNNVYVVSNGSTAFTYDVNANKLTVNNKNIKVRILYPMGVDLSTTNTLTFMGGRGETNFDGLFDKIDKDKSIVKSAGILILVAEGKNMAFDGDAGAYATQFVQTIIKQKSGVKNSILGFSDGAHKVMQASNKVIYDRIVVFSGYTDGVQSLENAKNAEVMFIIAPNDGNYSQAKAALRNMKNSGYTNVTVITNGTDAVNLFSDKFFVITPGSLMKNAHDTINVLNSGIIGYLND